MKKEDKRGELLVGTLIFIILNIMFLTILFLFISQQGNGLIVLEQSYAKQIALVVDSAKPGMEVFLDFEEGFKKAEESFGEDFEIKNIIIRTENIITVKLDNSSRRKGYSYSYFNNISFEITKEEERDNGIYLLFE